MIESLQTPISMKLQLIPVLRHMHHDANTAALVKTLCVNLLPKYPSENFVVVILDSLTQLSCATLIDIPDQVNLLLTFLQDPRKRVRYQILRSMLSLAQKGAHLWPKGALRNLISKAMTCKYEITSKPIAEESYLKILFFGFHFPQRFRQRTESRTIRCAYSNRLSCHLQRIAQRRTVVAGRAVLKLFGIGTSHCG